ncbi:MAG: VOC family protein [Anaerolineales bacterium]|nr:MAG: VOC family protein [Anaerolineales bacterium]
MKIDAVGISSTNLEKTVAFYKLLGFQFSEYDPKEQHLEPLTPDGSARLMIDAASLLESILGEAPRPGNHSSFAVRYDSPAEVDRVAAAVKAAGHTVPAEPWDAEWDQRYAIVQDPDGYRVDLYAVL